MRRSIFAVIVSCALVGSGCPSESGNTDGGRDAAPDVPADVAQDAPQDLAQDAVPDLPPDAPSDLAVDAMPDLSIDAPPDLSIDAPADLAMDGPTTCGLCGNGTIDPGETCDGNCPATCDDGHPCTTDRRLGAAGTCDVVCHHTPAGGPFRSDGCCVGNASLDGDCDPVCGNGVDEPGELCDGNCPTSCYDGDPCTVDSTEGSLATCDLRCVRTLLGTCTDGDGCCASPCTSSNDDDCSPTCGNGVIDSLELCDGNCPARCDDGTTCTQDTLHGEASRCTAFCGYQFDTCGARDFCCLPGCTAWSDVDCSGSCGNGVVEPGEVCDANCPTSCPDDGDVCTTEIRFGLSASCNVSCENRPITECVPADGCCPACCDASSDSDCSTTCGDGVVDSGETCDGNCPTACDDVDPCTIDRLRGRAGNCDVECEHVPVTSCVSPDACCPAACTPLTDADCE